MKFIWKLTALILLLAFGGQFLSACGASATTKPVTIVFYKRGYAPGGADSASAAIDAAVAAFQKRNPAITVQVVGIPWTADGTAQLEAALASGQGIHVCSVNATVLAQYARQGYLSSIDPYLTAADQADFYASGLDAVLVDGQHYAWPLWVTTVPIYANTTIFQERGVTLPTLDDPWTWDEFVAAAQQLTFQRADGAQVYGFNAPSKPGTVAYYPLMYVDGGRTVSPDGRRFIQNQPESISALQKIVDLAYTYKVTPPEFGNTDQATVRTQFQAGAVAMVMETPAFVAELEKSTTLSFAVLPPPVGDLGQIVTTGAFGMYGVAKLADPDELAAAQAFAKYLTSSEVAKDVPGYQLAPGLRRSNTGYASTPAREMIARLVSFGLYEPSVLISNEVRNQYDLALQSIMLGEQPPQDAMDAIAPIYQAALDQQLLPVP